MAVVCYVYDQKFMDHSKNILNVMFYENIIMAIINKYS